jgi:hypothetical protein
LEAKKSRNFWRISELFMAGTLPATESGDFTRTGLGSQAAVACPKSVRKMKKPAQGGLSEGAAESTIARGAILATVMIAIVLAVVLFLGDVAALYVLRLLDPRALLLGHLAIRLGLVFHGLHALLTLFQFCCFLVGQLAGLATPWSMRFCCSA